MLQTRWGLALRHALVWLRRYPAIQGHTTLRTSIFRFNWGLKSFHSLYWLVWNCRIRVDLNWKVLRKLYNASHLCSASRKYHFIPGIRCKESRKCCLSTNVNSATTTSFTSCLFYPMMYWYVILVNMPQIFFVVILSDFIKPKSKLSQIAVIIFNTNCCCICLTL